MKPDSTYPQTDRPVGLAANNRLGRGLSVATALIVPDGCLSEPGGHAYTRQLLASARREAEALAWATGYPHLVLPTLLEEKLQVARRQAAKQRQVTRDTARCWSEAIQPSLPGFRFLPREPVGQWYRKN